MTTTGKGKIPLTTKDVAEMVRCPVCRERSADPCNFFPPEGIRQAREYELAYHHDRLREAERVLDTYVLGAITNDIRSHARHLVMSLWELAVAFTVRPGKPNLRN